MSAAVPPPDHEPAPPALAAAREFVARGWRPFPVEYGGKRPAVGIKWGTATAAEPSDKTLELWFGREPVNVGIACRGSGLVVLDDDHGDGMTRLCEAYGRDVPATYRVRTAKGWHWYFTAPDDVEIGNAAGLLADFGFDVRGGRGDGGYVVAAGSLHESGHVYAAEDPDADTVDLPWWLIELLMPEPEPAADLEQNLGDPNSRSRSERLFTTEQAVAYVERYGIEPLRSAEPGRRNTALNTAAMVTGHFCPAFWPVDEAAEALASIARDIGLDESEIGPTVRSGLTAGMREPYGLADPFGSASGSSAPETDDEIYARELATEVRRERLRRDARDALARERRADRPRIADGLIDDLDAIEPPKMLLGSLIPENAVGFLAGRSGAYKSFLAVAWACCIATGRPWLGRDQFAVRRPLKTLYVAAEGSAGAAGRIRAWETANGASRRGKLLLYPRAIHLNDPAQVEELTAVVVDQGIEFLVVDTYHRSAPGTEENSSTDFGVVFESAARLRDEHGCGVLFVDHTGAAKTGNPRGTTAKRDDADYVLSASYLGETATADAQRELFVTKLKDVDTAGSWPIRLVEVEGEPFPAVGIGAVEVTGPLSTNDLGEWWHADRVPEIPERVAAAIDAEVARSGGRGAYAARWVWRYLAVVNDDQGNTWGRIRAALAEIPGPRRITPVAIEKAVPLLDRAGVVDRDRTRVWLSDAGSA